MSELAPPAFIWCCTGFDPSLERFDWPGELNQLPHRHGRHCVGPPLEFSGCFVTGWLAELWVGPAARNISGARHAATRIVKALRPQLASLDHRALEAA